jgi:hypothetical protein
VSLHLANPLLGTYVNPSSTWRLTVPNYKITRASTALSTTNDLLTLIAAANRRAKVVAIHIGGMGTASAANSLIVQKSTGGVTGGGAITPQPTIADSPAATTVVNTTWGTQPTLAAAPLLRLPVNANGGAFRWVALTEADKIEIRNNEQLSFRSETGTSNVIITVEIEE